MTILQREHSPDGILIHLEDWSCEYKAAKNATIALYPVAQNNICNNGRTYPKKGKLFRVSFDFESAAEAQSAFFSIISGKKNILDYLNKYSSETIRKEDFLKALKKEIRACEKTKVFSCVLFLINTTVIIFHKKAYNPPSPMRMPL